MTALEQPQAWSIVPSLSSTQRLNLWRSLVRHRGGAIGGSVCLLLVVVALFAPQFAPHDPTRVSALDRVKGPSLEFWMGTDELGRDIFSRIVFGTRVSIVIGLVTVTIAAIGGTVLGLMSGYFGSTVDALILWFIVTLMALPDVLLAICIAFALGPGLIQVMIAVGIASIPIFARVVRAEVLRVREEPYVECARALGSSTFGILFRHILPNIFAPLIVMITVRVAGAILIAAGLSFLGLGAQPPTPEWGTMVNAGRQTLRTAWWISTFPGIMITIMVIALNLLGDALRDILDPRFSQVDFRRHT